MNNDQAFLEIKRGKWIAFLIIVVLSILMCVSTNAQSASLYESIQSVPKVSPMSFNINIGDSEANGLFGAELGYKRYSISAGWRPGITPDSKRIDSWSTALSVYGNEHTDISRSIYSFYLTMGYASEAYVYSTYLPIYPYYGQDFKKAPAIVVLVGCKSIVLPEVSKRLAIKAGVGFKASEQGTMVSFEVLISINQF
jgi:hypothetical protein